MILVVVDTNIFISGIFWKGNFCYRIIELWKQNKITLVSSYSIIEELVKTLKDFKIQMPIDMIMEWEETIVNKSLIVEPKEKFEVIKDDSDDNKFLECAVEGNADYIISQDKHLLKLQEFRGIKIINPKEFLKTNFK